MSMLRLTGLVECVEESEGLRRDGAWEHGVLQQRAAGEAALHEPPHVCLLMHVGAAQARTRLKDRQRVHPAAHWGRFDPAQHVSTVPKVKCNSLSLDVFVPDGLVRTRAYNSAMSLD